MPSSSAEPSERSDRRRAVFWIGLAVVYAVIAGAFRPFTAPANVSTALGGLTVLVLAKRCSRPEPPPRLPRAIATSWWAWLTVATGWELWALSGRPRSAYPTISSLVDILIDTHPTRSLAVFAWLSLGWWLCRR